MLCLSELHLDFKALVKLYPWLIAAMYYDVCHSYLSLQENLHAELVYIRINKNVLIFLVFSNRRHHGQPPQRDTC